jgi:hypothetical protein
MRGQCSRGSRGLTDNWRAHVVSRLRKLASTAMLDRTPSPQRKRTILRSRCLPPCSAGGCAPNAVQPVLPAGQRTKERAEAPAPAPTALQVHRGSPGLALAGLGACRGGAWISKWPACTNVYMHGNSMGGINGRGAGHSTAPPDIPEASLLYDHRAPGDKNTSTFGPGVETAFKSNAFKKIDLARCPHE